MTPLERYQADLKRPDFFHDAAQETAVRHLQRLYDDLVAPAEQAGPARQAVWQEGADPGQGPVLLGRRGRGKTYLVDTFFEALPFKQKMRTHFHRFMKRVHEEMKTLKGEKNPLTIIAKRFATKPG
jgi:cell division protein ZapE